MDTSKREDTEHGSKDDETAPKPAGDVEAYESEWYEVLKRRAEEADAEEAEAGDDEAEDGEGGER